MVEKLLFNTVPPKHRLPIICTSSGAFVLLAETFGQFCGLLMNEFPKLEIRIKALLHYHTAAFLPVGSVSSTIS